MHAAVVLGGLDVVVHRAALRVLAQVRVVVRRARLRHVRRPRPCMPATKMPSPISQSASAARLAEHPLLDAGAEHVGHRLVERPGLPLVGEPGGVLGDRVGELVAEHVDRLGEPLEDLAVAVAEDQLGAVPEGVVVVAARSARWRSTGAPFPSYDARPKTSANSARVPVTPDAASSTAASPDSGSPAERTGVPGSVGAVVRGVDRPGRGRRGVAGAPSGPLGAAAGARPGGRSVRASRKRASTSRVRRTGSAASGCAGRQLLEEVGRHELTAHASSLAATTDSGKGAFVAGPHCPATTGTGALSPAGRGPAGSRRWRPGPRPRS